MLVKRYLLQKSFFGHGHDPLLLSIVERGDKLESLFIVLATRVLSTNVDAVIPVGGLPWKLSKPAVETAAVSVPAA